jgi:chorismate synthase
MIRELGSAEEMALCEALEAEVWGLAPRALVPASQLVAAAHAGGLVAAAFQGPRAVGFVYGFPSFRPELRPSPGHHSHMPAVLPAYRGRGLGQELKRFQRDWCLARGILWITWTFDPLQRKNARLNLTHLGAEALEYRVNEYGPMNDRLNRGLPSDRLLALWDLRREAKPASPTDVAVSVPIALGAREDGRPAPPNLGLDSAWLAVYSPDLLELLERGADLALAWRLAQREVMSHYLARGYAVTAHRGEHYLFRGTTTKPPL